MKQVTVTEKSPGIRRICFGADELNHEDENLYTTSREVFKGVSVAEIPKEILVRLQGQPDVPPFAQEYLFGRSTKDPRIVTINIHASFYTKFWHEVVALTEYMAALEKITKNIAPTLKGETQVDVQDQGDGHIHLDITRTIVASTSDEVLQLADETVESIQKPLESFLDEVGDYIDYQMSKL